MKSLSHASKSSKSTTKVTRPNVAPVTKVAQLAKATKVARLAAENVRHAGQVAKVAKPVVENVQNFAQPEGPAPAIAETPSAPVVAAGVVAAGVVAAGVVENANHGSHAPVVERDVSHRIHAAVVAPVAPPAALVEPFVVPRAVTPTVAEVASVASAPTPSAVDAVAAPVALVTELAIASIRLDGGTQSRASLSATTIAEYAEAMTAGAAFPPVVVFDDGKARWLADGFHRVNASVRLGRERIACEVREGSQRDAILFSVAANATHGLRRSNADKRHAVELLLADSKSDRWIADTCGVSHPFVSKAREQLVTVTSSPARATGHFGQLAPTREGKDGKARKLPASKPTRATAAPSVASPLSIAMAPTTKHPRSPICGQIWSAIGLPGRGGRLGSSRRSRLRRSGRDYTKRRRMANKRMQDPLYISICDEHGRELVELSFTEAVALIQYDLDPDPEDFAGRVLELAAMDIMETQGARESYPEKYLSMLECLRVRLELAVALNRLLKTATGLPTPDPRADEPGRANTKKKKKTKASKQAQQSVGDDRTK